MNPGTIAKWSALPLLIAGAVAIWAYNTYAQSQEAVLAAWSQVRNVEQRRMDLIPQLVAVTEAYAAHEQRLLADLQDARAAYLGHAASPRAVTDLERVDANLARVAVVLEQYPRLHASELYRNLQFELAGTENRIAVERRRYNAAAAEYRAFVRRFPLRLVPVSLDPPSLFSQPAGN